MWKPQIYGDFFERNKQHIARARNFDVKKDIPTREVLNYIAERLLMKYAEKELDFNGLFNDFIKNVNYISMKSISNGIPQWDDHQSKKISVSLRSKNGATRAKDKIGLQVEN